MMQRNKILDMLQGIQDSSVRLYRLFENYLLYAQLEVLGTDQARVATLKNDTTEKAISVIKDSATRRARIIERVPDLEFVLDDCMVGMSSVHLARVIEELVDNAFKFSPPGTSVKIEGTMQDANYVLRICDTGHGMSPEQIESIGAYMQFDRRVYEQQGLGLGLVNAKRLVELHGGTLTIESTPGGGTTVTVKV